MEAEASEGAESYHTHEEEFARFASESSDTDSSVPKVAEIVDLEADPDPVAGLAEAEGSVISRKRSFQRTSFAKSATGGEAKRTRVAHGESTKVAVGAQQRISEFPDETLVVSSGKLYCQACSTIISKKKSIVNNHIVTQRHKEMKLARSQQLERQLLLMQSFETYRKRNVSILSGTGLTAAVSDEVTVQCIQTVTTFLRAGVPLAKVKLLRPLIENNNFRLTDSTHLAQYIPFVLETEKERIGKEIKEAEFVSTIFDGSTRQGEALAVLIRFVSPEFEIKQFLGRFHVLSKSLTGEQLAREIITTLSPDLCLPERKVIAAIRDGASVNGAALNHVRTIMYPQMVDIICLSHSLDNVGKRFDTPTLDTFSHWWVSLFSHSPVSKLRWRTMAGESITTYSTRWWSWWKVLKQLQRLFPHVRPFLEALDSSPAVRRHLLDVIEDEDKFRQLKLELAVVIDSGELATLAYDLLQEVSTACGLEDYPLLEAVANDLADGNDALKRQVTTMAKQCVRPAIAYFREKFSHIDSPLQRAVQLFKALRMFCPFKVASLNLVPNRIDDLRRLPAWDHDETIRQLKTELPIYLVAAREAGPADSETQLQWWRKQTRLPTWQLAAKAVFSLVPSSAPAERVFSLLKAHTNHLQTHTLENHLETALMLQFNSGHSTA